MFLSTVDDDDELLISALRDAETLHLPDDSDQVLIEAAPLNAGLLMYCFSSHLTDSVVINVCLYISEIVAIL